MVGDLLWKMSLWGVTKYGSSEEDRRKSGKEKKIQLVREEVVKEQRLILEHRSGTFKKCRANKKSMFVNLIF